MLRLRREAREDAARAQRRLAGIARGAKMPMLGPNCMGLINHALGAGLSFVPEYTRAPRQAGSIAVVSQSGALGYSLAQAWERGLGIRYFFSVGNSADIDVGDLIAAMAEDPDCKAIACLFEGATSAVRMLEGATRAPRGQAGDRLQAGASGTARRGARATGSLAGSGSPGAALRARGFIP